MAKIIKTGSQKKESSVEKRRRRENIAKARAQARLFVFPLLVVGFVLLAGWLFLRFGTGKKLTMEEREKIRNQREMAKMMRQYGGDYDKLKELLKAAGVSNKGQKATEVATEEAVADTANVAENKEIPVDEVVADE